MKIVKYLTESTPSAKKRFKEYRKYLRDIKIGIELLEK